MFIGLLTIELEITDSLTLKDKRQVVKSLLDRIRHRFNVSAAEVDRLDSRRFAVMAAVAVANEEAFVHRMLEKVTDLVESEPRSLVLGHQIEML